MIVYGDPQFEATLEEAVTWLIATARSADQVDLWRTLLIQAGQIEQAVGDQPLDSALRRQWLPEVERWTDLLADAFVAQLHQNSRAAQYGATVQALLKTTRAALGQLSSQQAHVGSDLLRFKVPEGYEFYTLFPEQYCQSARAWLADHPVVDPRGSLVIGVRAIGSSLSAVVAAVLRQAGWDVQRITVRPSGHPYDRDVAMPGHLRVSHAAGIVVDEGPGLSGSSMAAVARALERGGLEAHQISFFPGHSGLPGPAASEQIRQRWSRTRRYCGALDMRDPLRAAAERLLDEPVKALDDVGGGAWRACAYAHPAEWPAVAARFETAKYLCTTASGRRILWKFIGLGSWIDRGVTALQQAGQRSASGHGAQSVLPILASFRGFVALPWIEGVRLTRAAAAEPALIEQCARYIVQSVGPPLSVVAEQAAVVRLRRMQEHNLSQGFGNHEVHQLARLPELAILPEINAASGDGRLAPHEWLRTPSGQIIKCDSFGHASDHTVIGRQSALWDVAGFMVEWDLDKVQRQQFLTSLIAAGFSISPDSLAFYETAYAAFRLGQMAFCRDLEPPQSEERRRLTQACDSYCGYILARTLT